MKTAMNYIIVLSLIIHFTKVGASENEQISIAQFVKVILENSPEIEASRLKIEAKAFDIETQKASFLPSINAIHENTKNSAERNAALQEIFPEQQEATRLNAKLNLFNGGKDLAAYKTSMLQENLSKNDLEKLKITKAIEAIRMYLEFAKTSELITILNTKIKSLKTLERNIETTKKMGRTSKSFLLGVKANIQNSEIQVLKYQESLRDLQIRIKFETSDLIKPSNLPQSTANLNLPEIDKNTNYESIDFKRMQIEKEIIEQKMKTATSQFLPSIDLQSNYFLNSNNSISPKDSWNAGITVTIPIFNGGATINNRRSADKELLASEIKRKAAVTIDEKEQSLSLSRISGLYEQINSSKSLLIIAKEQLASTQTDFSRGLISEDKVLDSINLLQSSQFEYANLITEYSLSVYDFNIFNDENLNKVLNNEVKK